MRSWLGNHSRASPGSSSNWEWATAPAARGRPATWTDFIMRFSLAPELLLVTALGCSAPPRICVVPPDGAAIPGIAFPVGTEAQFTAGRLDIVGECATPAPPAVEWSSSASAIAEVEQSGVLRALSPGTADVIARAGDVEDRYTVTVTPIIARVAIIPGDTVIAEGDTVLFRAVAYGVDGGILADAILKIQLDEHPSTRPGGGPSQVYLVDETRKGATPQTTNAVKVYARSGPAHASLTAWVMGRADTVEVRTVPR